LWCLQAREMMYHKTNINRIMSEYTGQTVETIEADTDRDRYMSPIEAKTYGLIDHVVGGDDAGYAIDGSTTLFPRNKPDHTAYARNEDVERFRGSRFRKATEPYVLPLAPKEGFPRSD
jgi:ATP-dependent Clp protease, protease subunit